MNIYDVTLIIDSPAHNVPYFSETGIGYKIIDYVQREKIKIQVVVTADSPEHARQKIKENVVLDKDLLLYDIIIRPTDYTLMIT